MENLFHAYWWLIFPVFGMFVSFWGLYSHQKMRAEKLKLIKSYIDQGKEPPSILLSALGDIPNKSNETKGAQESLTSLAVFAALAAAFGYFGFTENEKIFIAMSIGFGIGAIAALISAIIRHKQGKD